jgi:hypothetical protein
MAEKSGTTGPDERPPVLRACRNLKMAASAHAYVRGNTLKFYEWLAAADKSKIPQGRRFGSAAIATLEILAPWPIKTAKSIFKSAISTRR